MDNKPSTWPRLLVLLAITMVSIQNATTYFLKWDKRDSLATRQKYQSRWYLINILLCHLFRRSLRRLVPPNITLSWCSHWGNMSADDSLRVKQNMGSGSAQVDPMKWTSSAAVLQACYSANECFWYHHAAAALDESKKGRLGEYEESSMWVC